MAAEIYERVEAFLDFMHVDQHKIKVSRYLICDDHACRIELKLPDRENRFEIYDIMDLSRDVCKYVYQHYLTALIDHFDYADQSVLVDIFDSEFYRMCMEDCRYD